MGLLVFDTETTGFMPGSICQLSYILAESGRVCGKNFYFAVRYIEPGAQRVHGLTVEKLSRLSGDKQFSEHVEAIHQDFGRADLWIAHNFDFDARFLGTEFQRCSQSLPKSRSLCTMKHFAPICRLPGKKAMYKYPNLEELVRFFGIRQEEIVRTVEDLFGKDSCGYHDARYDTAATYLCYQQGADMGYIAL